MNKFKLMRLFCLVTFVVNLTACDDDNDVKKYNKVTAPLLKKFEVAVDTTMVTYNVPGVAIAIVEGDEIIYTKGFGMRNLENQEPVTPYTVFPIGSMSKSMTSMMIATLVDDGVLDWNQRVVEIWPNFTLPTKELTNNVKVRHLMEMNTGLVEDANRFFYDTRNNGISPEEQLDSLVNLSIVAEIEQKFYYNNHIYAATAHIGALAYGVAYGDLFNGFKQLMQERIFNPIGMESAVLSFDPSVGNKNYATGYAFNFVNNTFEPIYNPNLDGYAAVGGVSANVIDLARFIITQLNQGIEPNGIRVVSAKNLMETQKSHINMDNEEKDNPFVTRGGNVFYIIHPLAQSLYYGMGWMIAEQSNGVQMIGHSGGFEGYTSYMAFIPEADIGIVILTNLNFFHGVLDSANFIGVVKDSFFELLYNLEPKVTEERAKQHQQMIKETSIPWETMQVQFNADTVPFLGNYEKSWRVELRDDGTLWVVLLEVHEYQLVLLQDGTYRISNSSFSGRPVSFSKNDDGIVTMTITTIGTDTVAKID